MKKFVGIMVIGWIIYLMLVIGALVDTLNERTEEYNNLVERFNKLYECDEDYQRYCNWRL